MQANNQSETDQIQMTASLVQGSLYSDLANCRQETLLLPGGPVDQEKLRRWIFYMKSPEF